MFDIDLKFGARGEDVIYNYLRHSPKTKVIMDVSQAKTFQEEDVDFIVQTIDNQVYKVEIKTDRQADRTGNICYETRSNSNEGCLSRSTADYVFYVTAKKIYVFNLKDVRYHIDITCPKEVPMGDNARGYLLDIEELKNANVIKEII